MFAISQSLRAASPTEQHAIFKYISAAAVCRARALYGVYISLLIRSLSCSGHETKLRNGFWNRILHSESSSSLRQAAVWGDQLLRHNHNSNFSCVGWHIQSVHSDIYLWMVLQQSRSGFWLVGAQFNFLPAPQCKWFHVSQTVHSMSAIYKTILRLTHVMH
jgi:hypothetical protein